MRENDELHIPESGRQVFQRLEVGRPITYPDTNGQQSPHEDVRTARAIVNGIPNDGVEHAHVVAYTARMVPLAWGMVATGGVDMTPFAPREIFGWALTIPRCRYVGVAHNHPSGDTSPSGQDRKATQIVAGVGKALGIDVVYSLVVTHENDTWYAIPLEGKLAPSDPNDPGPKPQGDPNEDEGPEEDPEEDDEGPQEPQESPEEDEGDPEGVESSTRPPVKDPNDTANLDDLKAAVGKALKGGGK